MSTGELFEAGRAAPRYSMPRILLPWDTDPPLMVAKHIAGWTRNECAMAVVAGRSVARLVRGMVIMRMVQLTLPAATSAVLSRAWTFAELDAHCETRYGARMTYKRVVERGDKLLRYPQEQRPGIWAGTSAVLRYLNYLDAPPPKAARQERRGFTDAEVRAWAEQQQMGCGTCGRAFGPGDAQPTGGHLRPYSWDGPTLPWNGFAQCALCNSQQRAMGLLKFLLIKAEKMGRWERWNG